MIEAPNIKIQQTSPEISYLCIKPFPAADLER